MATYRAVKGYSIKSVSSDPANIKEGQIWYNSSAKKIKVAPKIAAWSAGGNLGTIRSRAGGTLGSDSTQSAGMAFGGQNSTGLLNLNEEYDGSSWTAGGTMNRGASQCSYAGLQTDGISFGGTPPTTATEHYNGTAWTNYPAMATARYALAGASGTATAAMGAGGYAPPDINSTEEFNDVATTRSVDVS